MRIDETSRQIVPRRVLRERRIGEPGAHPVVEPPVEFGQPGEHPLDAVVAGPVPIRDGDRPLLPHGGVAGSSVSPASNAGEVGPAVRSRLPTTTLDAPTSRGCIPGLDQVVTCDGAVVSGTSPCTHNSNSASTCLHGWRRLGQVQRDATPT